MTYTWPKPMTRDEEEALRQDAIRRFEAEGSPFYRALMAERDDIPVQEEVSHALDGLIAMAMIQERLLQEG
jgi:hypothetical protein